MNDQRECKYGKYFCCTRLRMLDYLTQKGFMYERVATDKTNPRMKNWIYRNSPELEDAITAYFKMQRERKEKESMAIASDCA